MTVRNLTGRFASPTSPAGNSDTTTHTGSSSSRMNEDEEEFSFQDPRMHPQPTNPFASSADSGASSPAAGSSTSLLGAAAPGTTALPLPQDLSRTHIETAYRGYYQRPNNTYAHTPGSSANSPQNTENSGNFPNTENSAQFPNTPLQLPRVMSDSENQFIQATPPYDRYPIVNSRMNSGVLKPPPGATAPFIESTHNIQGSQGSNLNYLGDITAPQVMAAAGSSGAEGSTSSSSNCAVPGLQDFSPFGGYPASSFPLTLEEKEDDDFIHNPDPEEEARLDRERMWSDIKHMNSRSFFGLIGVLVLLGAGIVIFIVLPVLTYTGAVHHPAHNDAHKSGSSSSSSSSSGSSSGDERLSLYRYPTLAAVRTSLIDPDTPSSANTRKALDGSKWQLVFSDEFNADGRTFYDGDDQFWTAPDIHYDATKDLEWYDPDAVTTKNGTLHLRMDAFLNHDLYYRSGMVQSWNKLCFTQGILEISANLPNYGSVTGLWPGMWTMGNLGRPGYLASTDGVWPYSYEACDAGITPNQSSPDGISYLPGQKLNACTCDGEDHPNPGVGRGAPEIDIIEGEVDTTLGVGLASQSMQIAPFDIWYMPDYDFIEVYNFSTTSMNTYAGGPFQQAVSAVSTLNTTWYEFGQEAGYFQKFALEYLNDDDDGYCRWFVGDQPTFTVYANALHPNGNVDWRRISKEPMSIVMNLGISNNWAYIDWRMIFFPVQMRIDYVRLYQPSNAVSITCDPEDYPTYDYIEAHKEVYTNANLTHWSDAGYSFPEHALTGNCKASSFKGTVVSGSS